MYREARRGSIEHLVRATLQAIEAWCTRKPRRDAEDEQTIIEVRNRRKLAPSAANGVGKAN